MNRIVQLGLFAAALHSALSQRRLPDAKPSLETRPVDWAIAVAIILILLVLSYFTIPTGRGGF